MLRPHTASGNNPFARAMAFVARLSLSQRRALDAVNDAVATMQRWHGRNHDELKNDAAFEQAYQQYVTPMIRAIRAGLTDHPAVQAFIVTRQSFGSRKTLRRARSGIEKGARRQVSVEELYLRHEIATLTEDYRRRNKEPITQSRARQLLIVGGKLPKMTKQAFNRHIKRLQLTHYFRR